MPDNKSATVSVSGFLTAHTAVSKDGRNFLSWRVTEATKDGVAKSVEWCTDGHTLIGEATKLAASFGSDGRIPKGIVRATVTGTPVGAATEFVGGAVKTITTPIRGRDAALKITGVEPSVTLKLAEAVKAAAVAPADVL